MGSLQTSGLLRCIKKRPAPLWVWPYHAHR